VADVVIIGGGVGGLVAAKRLRRALGTRHRLTVIDRAAEHLFQPSLLWVADGSRRPAGLSRPLTRLNRRGTSFHLGNVDAVDPVARRVHVGSAAIPYDFLLLAPGAELRPDLLPGLEQGGHNLYTTAGATAIDAELAHLKGGRVVVLVASMPFKCPAAPYEAAMLIEARLRARGVRSQFDVAVYTPEPLPMPVAGPALGAAVREMLAMQHVDYFPGQTAASVDPAARTVTFASGTVAPYDLLVYIPPHSVPSFAVDAGLAPANGWVTVDPATFATPTERVWAVGDVTGVKLANGKFLPKAGVFARAEAEVVAANIGSLLTGETPTATFDGRGACFIETGDGRAGYATGEFYSVPDPNVRPRPVARRWHWVKVLIEQSWFALWL
jgi:sulfide:quinone oxidoreductase